MPDKFSLKIGLCGAGLGGLATAIAFARPDRARAQDSEGVWLPVVGGASTSSAPGVGGGCEKARCHDSH